METLIFESHHPSSEKYYSLLTQMMDVKWKTANIKDIEKYFSLGEQCLAVLPYAIEEWKINDKNAGLKFELPPSIPCRDTLPGRYMSFGKYDDARRITRQCFKIGISTKREASDRLKMINDCEYAIQQALLYIRYNPGILQRTLRSKLTYVDKESLNWVLRYSKQIVKTKSGSTNALFCR
jgi:hypothetical protein